MSKPSYIAGQRLAVTALVLALGWSFAFTQTDADLVTLQGEIEPAIYDDDGEITAVMIFDREWGSVLIDRDGKGSDLLEHVGSIATVRGTIHELDDDSDFSYAIQVVDYTIGEDELEDAAFEG